MHPFAQSLHRIAVADRDAALAREGCAATRWSVRRHSHDVDPVRDQVAKVGSLAGDANPDVQLNLTRSGPDWRTTFPTTIAWLGTCLESTTRIMPSPMLNVAYISSS